MKTKKANKPLDKDTANHGKQPNQKMKPYLVYQYLMKRTDENHGVSAEKICAFLENCGISAERRSIYRDIEEINKILWLLDNIDFENDVVDVDIFDAEEAIHDKEERAIIYDKKINGFYVRQRHYDPTDIRLLAESIYASKFLTEAQSKRLVSVVCDFVSVRQAKVIVHNAFLTDRVKTDNKSVLNNISLINDAMSDTIDGEKHIPEKISFKYLRYSVDDLGKQIERRHGEKYVVSPFQLLINDSNYYLLGYDDHSKKIRTYRVDRMKAVSFTGEPREGAVEFENIDLKSFTRRIFSMYGGESKRVTIRFINPLLDTAIERFGKKGVFYHKIDDTHFTVTAEVEISDQFFGWLLGFGNKAKLISPDDVTERFKAYLDKVRGMY